jgi:hypothetical protein
MKMQRARLSLAYIASGRVPILRQLEMPRRTSVRNIEATEPSFTMS